MSGKFLLLVWIGAPLAWAGDPLPTAKIPALPKNSSFSAANVVRDPFSQIGKGGSMERSVIVAANQDTKDLAQLFRITSVSIDRISLAIINRKAFAEKDFFRVRTSEKIVNVTVVKIHDGGVDLDCDGTLITVPVVRPKLKLDDD